MIPEELKLKTRLFNVFIIIPTVYFIAILIFAFGGIKQISASPDSMSSGLMIALFFILPVHLFSMFCLFYCLYFVAKTIKTAEWKRKVTFGNFAGEFFMVGFFPVGVWILQPRINKMFREQIDTAVLTV